MTEHFTRSTVSAEFYCAKCQKRTQHRIDDRRKGPCLECIARYDALPKVETPARQKGLFS
jgi:ribosomal protein L44E